MTWVVLRSLLPRHSLGSSRIHFSPTDVCFREWPLPFSGRSFTVLQMANQVGRKNKKQESIEINPANTLEKYCQVAGNSPAVYKSRIGEDSISLLLKRISLPRVILGSRSLPVYKNYQPTCDCLAA